VGNPPTLRRRLTSLTAASISLASISYIGGTSCTGRLTNRSETINPIRGVVEDVEGVEALVRMSRNGEAVGGDGNVAMRYLKREMSAGSV
jgi:hypothetical protein